MRVILLAASVLCLMGGAVSAQPSKMNPSPGNSGAEALTTVSVQPSKMNPSPENSGGEALTTASVQPSKMNPNPETASVEGLTGAMRDVESPWLDHAMHDVGTNPTGWKRQWCARSVNLWLQRSGKKGCGGNTAISCLSAGRKLPGPTIGALAVMKHHVGIVKEVHDRQVTLVSGNHSGRSGARSVGVGKYARTRIVAYVWPE
jgi:hypothetical protein